MISAVLGATGLMLAPVAAASDSNETVIRGLFHDHKNKEALEKSAPLLKSHPNNALYLELHATALFNDNQFQAVLPELDRLIRQFPDNMLFRKFRAFAYFQLADFKKGIADCLIVLKKHPSDIETRLNLVKAYTRLGMRSEAMHAQKQLDDTGCDPATLKAISKINSLVEGQHFDDSTALAIRESVKHPKSVELLFLAGASSYERMDYKQGNEYLTKVIKMEPKYCNVWRLALVKRARCRMNLLDYKAALADSTLALEKQHTQTEALHEIHLADNCYNVSYDALTVKTQALAALGHFDKALETISEQITQFPGSADLYLKRSQYHLRLKHYKLAVADCDKAVVVDRQNNSSGDRSILSKSMIAKFDIYCAQQDFENALKQSNLLCKMSPNDEEIHLERGYIYFRMGQYQKAVDDYTKAIELDSQKDEGFYYAARSAAYRKMGKIALADADNRKATELGTKKTHKMRAQWTLIN